MASEQEPREPTKVSSSIHVQADQLINIPDSSDLPASHPAPLSGNAVFNPENTSDPEPSVAPSHFSSSTLVTLGSQRIGPTPSTTKDSRPTEYHQDVTADIVGSVPHFADPQGAIPSSAENPSPASNLHLSLPLPSPDKSASEETSIETDLKRDLGAKLHAQLPKDLQRLVSPLFVDPYTDPSSVPQSYRSYLTSATFRDLFRDDYEAYVASKPKDSLPSPFDLEMMASSQMNLTELKDPGWVKARLKAYGLHQADDAAFERHPSIRKAAQAIIEQPRDSLPTKEDEALFKAKLQTYRSHNEDTFLRHMLPFLIKDQRKVPAHKSMIPAHKSMVPVVLIEQSTAIPIIDESRDQDLAQKADLQDSEDQVYVQFFSSGMIEIVNRDFTRTIPFFFVEDKDVEKALQKDANMTNPRPDRTFGVDPDSINWPQGFVVPAEIQQIMEVIRSCVHVFLVTEGKSALGNLNEAINQIYRDGAWVLHKERYLQEVLGLEDQVGPGTNTFMFSFVITDQVCQMWVHWAEVHATPINASIRASNTTYHMNLIMAAAIDEPSTVGKIGRALHNILDWGVGRRLDKQMKEVREGIFAYSERQNQAPTPKKQKTG